MIQFFSVLLVIAVTFVTVMASPVMAVGTETSEPAAPYDEAKAMVEEGSYAAALPKLVGLSQTDAGNADVWNLLGYTYRKLEQYPESEAAYGRALTLNPDHLGALEYQGELFITLGRLDEAKANLARLQTLCGDCEETAELAAAIGAGG